MSESLEESKQTLNDTNLNYWLDRWLNNNIRFHRRDVSELFIRHVLPKLISSEREQCIVFPLCGKTLDMKAVLDIGHRVIGIEGSQKAIETFFDEHKIPYEIEKDENNQCEIYKNNNHPITIYCADFLTFNQSLPSVDYIWDRGGLVAINPSDREKYRDCLYRLMIPDHTQLFIEATNYDDPIFTPPPHKLSDDEVSHLFGSKCSIQRLEICDQTQDFNLNRSTRPIDYLGIHLQLIVQKTK